MKLTKKIKQKPLFLEQLPLLANVCDPLALPIGPHTEREEKNRMRAGLLAGMLSMLMILSGVLYIRTQPIIPKVPIPTLQFAYSGPWSNMLSADLLSVVKNNESVFVNYLEPREGDRISAKSGEHTLVRVPYSIVGDISVSELFHPMHTKMRSFSVYKYHGDEPPFHPELTWRSRILDKRLGVGKNFTVSGGDLLYIMVEEEIEPDIPVTF
jgi:hypothetical protein